MSMTGRPSSVARGAVGFEPLADVEAVLALERPEPALWKLYLIRSILSGPVAFLLLPLLFFRYHTLRYRFDANGFGPTCDPNQRPAFDVRHPRAVPPDRATPLASAPPPSHAPPRAPPPAGSGPGWQPKR